MVSLEHNCGNISPTICTNLLIFGKDTFLVFNSCMILRNPISSQSLSFLTLPLRSIVESGDLSLDLRLNVQRVIGSNPVGFQKLILFICAIFNRVTGGYGIQ